MGYSRKIYYAFALTAASGFLTPTYASNSEEEKAGPQSAFNLICTGTWAMGEILKMSEPLEVATTIRIDLERGRWCSDACRTTARIYHVSDTLIVLRNDGDVFDADKNDASDNAIFVKRESGEYIDRSRLWVGGKLMISLTQAKCEKSDFTGFPERKF